MASAHVLSDPIERELALGIGASIIDLVGSLVTKAVLERASDIHIDPNADGLRVRLRVDGVLRDAYHFPSSVRTETIARIKVLSSLRTDEHQTAQDGRFRHVLAERGFVDVRVSVAPTYYGERAVLRLLSDSAADFTLERLGFSHADREKIVAASRKPSGMILATGPTGSGKTTTLYTLIKMLNSKETSIITIEDPIEYAIDGIEQIQVNARSGLTFGNGLRAILRQDPNIIMVGEIRDPETAAIAVNTALTGHLLLSTLHTNDAATTLPRLLDMKIESFLVASTVSLVIGQRLVRTICHVCKEPYTATSARALSTSGFVLRTPLQTGETLYRGMGCEACGGSGYEGRISINEVLVASEALREAILLKAPSSEIKRIAVREGMTTILDDGFAKARSGATTIEEVLRVIHE